MSQHDMVIDNQLGAALRGDLNNALAALVTQSAGATAPATTYAYMIWADTTTGLLKQRNATNTAWIVKGLLGIGGALTASPTLSKAGAYTVLPDDIGSTFLCTGTWTLSLTAAATLGNGFTCVVRNVSTGIITIDPNGAELVNGQTVISLNPGESVWLVCSGTAWVTTSADWINKEGTAIASAATINLDAVYGDFVHVTGTAGITAVTLAQGVKKVVVFDGALTITNGASLILPGAANITTAVGDIAIFTGEGAGVTRCISFNKASGYSVAAGELINFTTITATNAAWAPNAATKKIVVCCIGAGAGGQGGTGNYGASSSYNLQGYSGVGGSAGAISYGYTSSVAPNYNAQVGAGSAGTSGSSANPSGNPTQASLPAIGGSTSFGALATAVGGQTAQAHQASQGTGTSWQKGMAGVADGGAAGINSATPTAGAAAAANSGAGGGGGGGATGTGSPVAGAAGGAGGSGLIYVWEYA